MNKCFWAAALVTAFMSTANAGGNASRCIQAGRGDNSQIITNNCNQTIGVNYCHLSSSEPGTKGTECGNGGRYYQQFTTLAAGASTGNRYSLPNDASIRWAACYGGEGHIHQTSDGQFNCRD